MLQLQKKPNTRNGFKDFAIDFLAGAAASLALPPIFFLPAIFIIGVPVWRVIHAPSRGDAARIFGFSGLGWFLASTYWVAHSVIVAAPSMWFFTPLLAIALAGILAVFWAVAAGLSWAHNDSNLLRLMRLIVLFAVIEWTRGFVATGFPWSLMGGLFAIHISSLQAASVLGVYGLTLVVFAFAVSPIFWLLAQRWVAVLCLFLPLAISFLGFLRLDQDFKEDTNISGANGPVIRLVQPAVPQSDKWDPEKRTDHLGDLVALSRKGRRDPDLVIWPETAFAALPHQNKELLSSTVAAATHKTGYLLTGIPRFNGKGQLQNSAFLLDHEGDLHGLYNKRHLVPFGEYIPFHSFLTFLDAIVGPVDFVAGNKNQIITVPNVGQVQMLICYEVIFSGRAIVSKTRPDMIVNITNDAWFGQTVGPLQHLYQAQLRAVEEGVPLLRAANTGITAAFDGYGRQLGTIPLGEKGYLDIVVPPVLSASVFAKFGNSIFFLLCIFIIAAVKLIRVKQHFVNRLNL